MTYNQEYNREAKNLSDSELKAKFKGVEKAWATAYKTQEEKLNLATQTYEMVNRYFWTKTPLIVVTFFIKLQSQMRSLFNQTISEYEKTHLFITFKF